MRTALLFTLSCSLAFPSPDGVDKTILAKMDTAGPAFRGMSAKIKRVRYTAIIKDKSEEGGTILLKKNSPRDVQMLIGFTAPDVRTLAFHGGKGEIYTPKINTVQEYDLGQYRGLVDQFLLLGFGTTGKDIAKAYTIKSAAKETVDGQETTHLSLVSKDKKFRDQFSEVELWVSAATGQPLQQKLVEPSGDYWLVTYQDMKVNPPLSADDLSLKLPKGVTRERPQK